MLLKVDFKAIKGRLKAEWAFVRGELDIVALDNEWVLLRFSNPRDRDPAWGERPWHVQGNLLVIQPWKPHFDLFLEKVKWVDLWVRLLRVPLERIFMNLLIIS